MKQAALWGKKELENGGGGERKGRKIRKTHDKRKGRTDVA